MEKYFERHKIQNLSIYGTGRIGQYFYNICKKIKINIPFCIDARIDYRIEDIPTRTYHDVKDGEVDCIVVASGYHYREMEENVAHLQKTKVVSLWEVLNVCHDSKFKINGM